MFQLVQRQGKASVLAQGGHTGGVPSYSAFVLLRPPADWMGFTSPREGVCHSTVPLIHIHPQT